jgi:hypothetical protein
MSAHATAPIIPEVEAIREIQPLYAAYQKTDTDRQSAGMELGRSLLRWREQYKAQGSRSGKGFNTLLDRLEIPKATAYRWMRKADPNFVPCETKSEEIVAFGRISPRAFNARISKAFEVLSGITCALDGTDIEHGPLLLSEKERNNYLQTGRTLVKQLHVLLRRLRAQAVVSE